MKNKRTRIVTVGFLLIASWAEPSFGVSEILGSMNASEYAVRAATRINSATIETVWRQKNHQPDNGNGEGPRFINVNIYGERDFRSFNDVEERYRNSFGMIGDGGDYRTGTAVVLHTKHPDFVFIASVAHNFYDDGGKIFEEPYFYVGGARGKKVKIRGIINGTYGVSRRLATQDDWVIVLVKRSEVGKVKGLGYIKEEMSSEEIAQLGREDTGEILLVAFHKEGKDRALNKPIMSTNVRIYTGGRDMGEHSIKHTADNLKKSSGGGLVYVKGDQMYLLGVNIGDVKNSPDGSTPNPYSNFAGAVNFSRMLDDFLRYSNPANSEHMTDGRIEWLR